mmetsp:Transcript_375/g.676  ORF Transcript_375/g.676 Transcript_375/m.676 type:complete len:214 (+) Transcript_375:832-1473(+)
MCSLRPGLQPSTCQQFGLPTTTALGWGECCQTLLASSLVRQDTLQAISRASGPEAFASAAQVHILEYNRTMAWVYLDQNLATLWMGVLAPQSCRRTLCSLLRITAPGTAKQGASGRSTRPAMTPSLATGTGLGMELASSALLGSIPRSQEVTGARTAQKESMLTSRAHRPAQIVRRTLTERPKVQCPWKFVSRVKELQLAALLVRIHNLWSNM